MIPYPSLLAVNPPGMLRVTVFPALPLHVKPDALTLPEAYTEDGEILPGHVPECVPENVPEIVPLTDIPPDPTVRE